MLQFAYIIGRGEKLSEDFYFRHAPTETQNLRTLYIFATTLMVILCSLSKFLAHIMTDKFTTAFFWVKISFEPRGIF
ncbi:hypothetical protein RchiOBHm_Chr1g0327621 [Rosa chinensis]|uniref:Uncharacterized protein n=1 Tax=Rosa chinensis TaxID=74649 RepID=A0A2P6SAL9_ROSCH|nr:hypothetical protein RchiOBHm_Chr1g0327621 [Rosa chinensis]